MYEVQADLNSARRKLTTGLCVSVALYVLVQYFRTPVWGHALRGEGNLWTVTEAMMDFLVAIIAFVGAVLGRYITVRRIASDRTWIPWLLISFAFLYFTFDETLQFHERMGRALYFTPAINYLKGFRPHNVVEATYYLGGVTLTIAILKRLRQNRSMFAFYMGGIGFMALQTFLGLIPKHLGNDRLPMMFPEILEMFALTCFACAFIALVFEQLSAIHDWLSTGRVIDDVAVEHVLPTGSVGK